MLQQTQSRSPFNVAVSSSAIVVFILVILVTLVILVVQHLVIKGKIRRLG